MSRINSYTDCKHHVTFNIGSEYQNFIGRYRIEDMEINENDLTQEPVMLVRYLDITKPSGEPLTQLLPVREQGRIVSNALRRIENYPELQSIDFSNSDFITTAGYLAQYGRIRVECPQSLHESFQEIYRCLTGDEATNHYGHGYAVVKDETKGTSFELRISFPTPIETFNFYHLPIMAGNNRMEINYVDFVAHLFRLGFVIGQNHKVDEIFDSLTENHRDYFIQGFNVIPESFAA
jgi:hypothetical protein